jgi:hypothetical protein
MVSVNLIFSRLHALTVIVCVIVVQFVRWLRYDLEISNMVFIVVVGKHYHDGLLLMQHRYLMAYKWF